MTDPILVRRARFAHLARFGQRLGYLAYGVAILVFVMGMATGFNDVVANTLVVLLVVGSFVLAPAIVLPSHCGESGAGRGDGTGRCPGRNGTK